MSFVLRILIRLTVQMALVILSDPSAADFANKAFNEIGGIEDAMPSDADDKSSEDGIDIEEPPANLEQETHSTAEEGSKSESEAEDEDEFLPDTMDFVDAHGEWHVANIFPDVEKHDYDWSKLHHTDDGITYDDDRYYIQKGVDVSHHLGAINWEKVKEAGYDFAFVRTVYRGYGDAGKLNADKRYKENIQNAQAAGLDVGIYVFSQAINDEEAAEEAEFTIKCLEGINLELPVVYDPEIILYADARTDDVTGEQFSRNTVIFCDMLEEAGYDTMIYSNMFWEAYLYSPEILSKYPIWYADYEKIPQTPYKFSIWQYTDEGRVPGIGAGADINIRFCPVDDADKNDAEPIDDADKSDAAPIDDADKNDAAPADENEKKAE